jgi:type III secretion system FlhB-like substrate exporter
MPKPDQQSPSQDLRNKIAIALCCDPEDDLKPKVSVTAKGYMAEQLKALARAHDIPIEVSPPLAEGLVGLKAGQHVPEEFFPVLAALMSHVESVQNKFKGH